MTEQGEPFPIEELLADDPEGRLAYHAELARFARVRAAIAPISRVDIVEPHPGSDKLDIVHVAGLFNVANRRDDGSSRYKAGDFVIVLREGLILPDWLIKHNHMWDDRKNKGRMAGSRGNRTKGRWFGPENLRIFSTVILVKIEIVDIAPTNSDTPLVCVRLPTDDGIERQAEFCPVPEIAAAAPEGIDCAAWLQIHENGGEVPSAESTGLVSITE